MGESGDVTKAGICGTGVIFCMLFALSYPLKFIATSYGFADVTTAATYELGNLHQDFAKALSDSERPKKLSALELEQYNLLLEEQSFPFEEKAIEAYESNLRRIPQGIYDEWVAKSAKALAVLAPGKYGKREKGEEPYESLR